MKSKFTAKNICAVCYSGGMENVVQIISIDCLNKRNIYNHKPVIKLVLDLKELHDTPTCDIDGLNDMLIDHFPGLKTHNCSTGKEGGFVERLKRGTYLAHVTEHLILEIQALLGDEVFYGKTRLLKEPSIYNIVYRFNNEKCAIECGRIAVLIMSKFIEKQNIDLEKIMLDLKKLKTESDLGPSTKAIYEEAALRGIPCSRIGSNSILQLGNGKYTKLIQASLTDSPSCISVDISSNKHLTKQILDENSIPVPYGDVVYSEESAIQLAHFIGYPVVIKPLDGNQGKGVFLNINDDQQLCTAYKEACKHSNSIIVEQYIKGKDYRVLVVGGKISAVSERRPPEVTGDGINTIEQLVSIENQNTLRGDEHENYLTKIKIDSVTKQVLSRSGIDETHIPKKGEIVPLRENANLSTGGSAEDCTELINPYNAQCAIKAANAIGLDIAGVDITTEDISKPLNATGGAIIEINAAPGLRMHLFPSKGKPVNVAKDILNMMYPENEPFSIPIISVTGTNGKTTTTRLIKHTISLMGLKVGMTTTSGIYVGDKCLLKGDNTGPKSAKLLLSNKSIECAVLETARGGLIRKGLGYDLADIGVVVNVSDDHLMLDGIETIEDLANVKALVIESIKPDGYAVINADDQMATYFLERIKCKTLLFSSFPNNPLIVNHIRSGGEVVYLNDNQIMVVDNKRSMKITNVEEIPITFDGLLECNIENALAATSALYALGIKPEQIAQGLNTFKPDAVLNPGRFNLFDLGSFKVMLDYSHNIAGYNCVIKFIKKLNVTRLVGVIGMPGDRLERNMLEVGELCGNAFSKIYIKEDIDSRGRKSGDVSQIILKGVQKGSINSEDVKILESEQEALMAALENAQDDDLIIMFYENFELAVDTINKFQENNVLSSAKA